VLRWKLKKETSTVCDLMNQYTILKAILRDKNDNTLFIKGKWAYTDVTPVNQLLKIADLIKPFYAAETVLLERMIYKNKNQHQRARYYKRIQQVRVRSEINFQ
jgi:hypothetical protein